MRDTLMGAMKSEFISIPSGSVELEGMLEIPDDPTGLALFAHGSGSSRHSERNNYVARVLRDAGIGTLLFDLLTEREDEVYETRFDIDLLTQRLLDATAWACSSSELSEMRIGYFGASTGAAAALKAAAELGSDIAAVVSRGGRPDMAEDALSRVTSPTLLIVGGADDAVIPLNEQAFQKLTDAEKELKIVEGATHLFEEPGALEEVAALAADWFRRYFTA